MENVEMNERSTLSVGGKLIAGMDREGEYINIRMYARRLTTKEASLLCEDIQQLCGKEPAGGQKYEE